MCCGGVLPPSVARPSGERRRQHAPLEEIDRMNGAIRSCIIALFSCTLAIAMNESVIQLKDTSANPAPLGLLGFGMTTVLLNLHNVGLYELNSMILAMGICYGGAAQIFAGIMEWKKGNTFAATAFLSYGFFWLSLITLVILPKLGLSTASNPTA